VANSLPQPGSFDLNIKVTVEGTRPDSKLRNKGRVRSRSLTDRDDLQVSCPRSDAARTGREEWIAVKGGGTICFAALKDTRRLGSPIAIGSRLSLVNQLGLENKELFLHYSSKARLEK